MTIWISHQIVHAIEEMGRRYHPLETGGVLLGWRDGDDRIIVGLIGPGPRSMHGRHAFTPDHDWQVRRIRKVFAATSGDLDYLGDWHTHPDGVAAMSSTDHATLRRIARRVPQPVMAIAAGASNDWRFGGWIGNTPRLFGRVQPIDSEIHAFEVPNNWPTYIDSDKL